MPLLFLAPCLVPRSGGFLVIGSSVNHQGKGCAKKGQCDLGPYFLQRDEVVVLRAGFLTVAGTLVDWVHSLTGRGGAGAIKALETWLSL